MANPESQLRRVSSPDEGRLQVLAGQTAAPVPTSITVTGLLLQASDGGGILRMVTCSFSPSKMDLQTEEEPSETLLGGVLPLPGRPRGPLAPTD